MKKFLALLLALCTLFSVMAVFSGCEKKSPSKTTTQPDPTTAPTEPEETIPEGNQVGDRCYGFDLELVDKNGATGEIINPATTGKVTVINFWGTWCGPCKAELPHFDQVAGEYDIYVIAIHSRDDKKEMPQYISQNFPDSSIIFAWDKTGNDQYQDEYYIKMGNVGAYPYTIILDADGIITFTKIGMMDHTELTEAIEDAGGVKK